MLDEVLAVEEPVVGGELHGEAVDDRSEPHRRSLGIGADEVAALDPLADDPLEQAVRVFVELLADPAHHRVAQRLTPRIDPEHPLEVAAALGHVVLQRPVELLDRRRRCLDLGLHLGEVLARVVGEGLGEELLLRVEVVVDEAARHAEPLGDVADAGGGEPSLDDDLAGDLEDLGAALFDGGLLH